MSQHSPRSTSLAGRLRGALHRRASSRSVPIVVASMGRSGSTLVFKAIRNGLAALRFGPLSKVSRARIADVAWDLSDCQLAPGIVYKTHALAHELPADRDARVVFMYGCASDAAASVLSCRLRFGPAWVAEHFEHMRATGSFDELGERDVLRFEEQIDGWLGGCSAPVLGIKYEALWDNIDALSNFLGFPVHLPERQLRSSQNDLDAATIQRISRSYARLDAKIAALPDCILRPERSDPSFVEMGMEAPRKARRS